MGNMTAAMVFGTLFASLTVATLVPAKPTYARNDHKHHAHAENVKRVVAPCIRPHPYNVRAGNVIIGRDPDPFIRGEILRNDYSGWPTNPFLGPAC